MIPRRAAREGRASRSIQTRRRGGRGGARRGGAGAGSSDPPEESRHPNAPGWCAQAPAGRFYWLDTEASARLASVALRGWFSTLSRNGRLAGVALNVKNPCMEREFADLHTIAASHSICRPLIVGTRSAGHLRSSPRLSPSQLQRHLPARRHRAFRNNARYPLAGVNRDVSNSRSPTPLSRGLSRPAPLIRNSGENAGPPRGF